MYFYFFPIFVLIALFVMLSMRKSSGKSLTGAEALLEREREANSTRKKPLTDINFVDIDLSRLPMPDTDDEYLIERYDKLTTLASSDTKVANLSEYSNTDLKLMYGVANLTILTEYDQNFTSLCRCLYEIGNRLNSQGDVLSAREYLEYGIECGTDMKSHYTLLADMYEENLEYTKILDLIKRARKLNTALKESLIRDLTSRLEGTNYSEDDGEVTVLEDVSAHTP